MATPAALADVEFLLCGDSHTAIEYRPHLPRREDFVIVVDQLWRQEVAS